MTATTISHNTAHFGGGIWIGHNAVAKITNDTIADNTATMGGGVWFAGGVTGTLLNVTVAGNAGNGMAGGDTGVTLRNTLVAGNTKGSLEGEVSCDHTHAGAGTNIEFPGDSELALHVLGRRRRPGARPLAEQRRRHADDGPGVRQPGGGQGECLPVDRPDGPDAHEGLHAGGGRSPMRGASTFSAIALFLSACGGSGAAGSSDAGGSKGPGGAVDAVATVDSGSPEDAGGVEDAGVAPEAGVTQDVANPGSCSPDPLHTGLTAQQTGVSVDAFDCPILEWAAKYNEPDPMIFKAIIYVESRFDDTSVARARTTPVGRRPAGPRLSRGCYGLMQVVPACGDDPNDAGLLPNGQPNMTTDMSASGWAGSIFNPNVNIEIGISGVAGNRTQVEKQFPGCTADQYTMMAVGNYNNYGSTKSCTVYNTAYDDPVVTAYKQYAAAAGYPAHR